MVSDEAKKKFCVEHGAAGVINRNEFTHWGPMPDTKDAKAYGDWAKGARAFGKAIWDALGERMSPRIVFEHPGEATLPTSGFVCATGGMIVICAGTTGYNVTMDLRYHWMRQKRFQGSHLSNDEQAAAVTALVADGRVDPCLSQTYGFDDIPECHQLMLDNKHPYGNMAVLVNATRAGLGASSPEPRSSGLAGSVPAGIAGQNRRQPPLDLEDRAAGSSGPSARAGPPRPRWHRPRPVATVRARGASMISRFLIVGVRSEISLRRRASSASAGVSQRDVHDLVSVRRRLLAGRRHRREESRIEADRILLRA